MSNHLSLSDLWQIISKVRHLARGSLLQIQSLIYQAIILSNTTCVDFLRYLFNVLKKNYDCLILKIHWILILVLSKVIFFCLFESKFIVLLISLSDVLEDILIWYLFSCIIHLLGEKSL